MDWSAYPSGGVAEQRELLVLSRPAAEDEYPLGVMRAPWSYSHRSAPELIRPASKFSTSVKPSQEFPPSLGKSASITSDPTGIQRRDFFASVMGNIVNQIAFPAPHPEYSRPYLEQRNDLVKFKIRTGEQIFALDIRSTAGTYPRPYTILYSHGNAEDVGLAIPYLEALSERTGCNVFAYEYTGYSLTEGSPSEQGLYDSIQAAYEYLLAKNKVDPDTIFIFGRSIGSGPSTDLASKLRRHECAGLILQSPLESGMRVFSGPTLATIGSPWDPFKNTDKIEKVQVPVLIIHGEADSVVPVLNGKNLYAKAKKKGTAVKPMWVPGRGHNDMPELDCIERTRQMIAEEVAKREEERRTGRRSEL